MEYMNEQFEKLKDEMVEDFTKTITKGGISYYYGYFNGIINCLFYKLDLISFEQDKELHLLVERLFDKNWDRVIKLENENN